MSRAVGHGGGQELPREVRICPGQWDRVDRCYSEESESFRVSGIGWAGATARSLGEWDRVGRCNSKESEPVQVRGTGWPGTSVRSQNLFS